MFAGEWFGSFHEFHASGMDPSDPGSIRVWDPVDADCYMTKEQARLVYEQAAMILTACYDLQTTEQISFWHHAAGDFVVNLEEPQAPKVKLITVRRYAPLLESVEETNEAMLNGLLLFFLNLTLHMRLDRLDGVKEVCWLEEGVVAATIRGFLQGLTLQFKNRRIPDGFIDGYKSFLAEIELATLQALFTALAGRFPKGSADTPIVLSHVEEHIQAFYRALRSPM
jgi:hypothetical protein